MIHIRKNKARAPSSSRLHCAGHRAERLCDGARTTLAEYLHRPPLAGGRPDVGHTVKTGRPARPPSSTAIPGGTTAVAASTADFVHASAGIPGGSAARVPAGHRDRSPTAP